MEIVTIDLTNHPIGAPLGMLLAPGALPSSNHHHLVNSFEGHDDRNTIYASSYSSSNNKNNNNHRHHQNNETTYQNEAQYSRHVLVAGWEHCTPPPPPPNVDNKSHNSKTNHTVRTTPPITLYSNQLLGPIQRSGAIRLGDRLVRINNVDVTDWTFREVMDALKEMMMLAPAPAPSPSHYSNNTLSVHSNTPGRKMRLKSLGFAPSNSKEWARGIMTCTANSNSNAFSYASLSDYLLFSTTNNNNNKNHTHVSNGGSNGINGVRGGKFDKNCIVHSKRLYSFASFIGGWRVVYPNDDTENNAAAAAAASATAATTATTATINNDNAKQNEGNTQSDAETSTPIIALTAAATTLQEGNETTMPSSPKKSTSATENNVTTSTPNKPIEKPFIQYEIECHLLFRDRFSNNSNDNIGNNNSNGTNNTNHHQQHHHHKWSTWKRYSEFAALDTELRSTFGWQMDAFRDGKGIAFPSAHGLESWWYGFRGGHTGVVDGNGGSGSGGKRGDATNNKNGDSADSGGGGYLSYLWGNDSNKSDGSTSKTDTERSGSANSGGFDGGGDGEGGLTSSLFAYFQSSGSGSEATTKQNKNNIYYDHSTFNDNPHPAGNDYSENPKSNHVPSCPYPASFMNKRQKELSAYWKKLMKIEDIFEFSDIDSHRFGKVMADFLGVNQILTSRRSSSMQQHNAAPASFPRANHIPVIHENETYGLEDDAPALHNLFTTPDISGLAVRDVDDESTLSDDNSTLRDASYRAMQNNGGGTFSPLRGKKVVDIVPNPAYSNGVDMNGGRLGDGNSIGTDSMMSGSLGNVQNRYGSSRRTRTRRNQKGVKPAFQRQLLAP